MRKHKKANSDCHRKEFKDCRAYCVCNYIYIKFLNAALHLSGTKTSVFTLKKSQTTYSIKYLYSIE